MFYKNIFDCIDAFSVSTVRKGHAPNNVFYTTKIKKFYHCSLMKSDYQQDLQCFEKSDNQQDIQCG